MTNQCVKSTVLIIEDDASTANDLMVEYRKAGDEVVICTDATEATKVAISIVPQLIIISLSLPSKDGILLALEMKQEKILEDIPVVFITPEIACNEVARLAFTIGAVDVISKPMKPTELKEMVHQTSLFKGFCQLRQLASKLHTRGKK